jgi:AcrR family transcriptional regulator
MPPVEDATGLRERKKQRTRADLADAADRLFAERGFDDVTIDEIAEAADVSPRTFYRYFASKEDLVLGGMDEVHETFRSHLATRPPDEPVIDSIRAAFAALAGDMSRDPERSLRQGALIRSTPSLVLRRVQRQAALEAQVTPMLAERLGSSGPDDLRAPLLLACAFSAFRIATIAWMQSGATASLPDLIDDALAQLAHGFR